MRHIEWYCDPVDAARYVRDGKTWAVVDEYNNTPVAAPYERAIVYLRGGWVTIRGRRIQVHGAGAAARLAHLTERSTPDGSRYWQWVPADEPGAMPGDDPVPAETAGVGR